MIVRPITEDQTHTFAQALIAAGWLNDDPNCVEPLQRLLGAFAASCELDPHARTSTGLSCPICCAREGQLHDDGCSLKDSK